MIENAARLSTSEKYIGHSTSESVQLYSTCYTALQTKNSRRSVSAMNPVTLNTENKALNP